MAKAGYIFLSKNYITEEEEIQDKLRPEWRKRLVSLKKEDTIIVSKLSHTLRGVREFGLFLDLSK